MTPVHLRHVRKLYALQQLLEKSYPTDGAIKSGTRHGHPSESARMAQTRKAVNLALCDPPKTSPLPEAATNPAPRRNKMTNRHAEGSQTHNCYEHTTKPNDSKTLLPPPRNTDRPPSSIQHGASRTDSIVIIVPVILATAGCYFRWRRGSRRGSARRGSNARRGSADAPATAPLCLDTGICFTLLVVANAFRSNCSSSRGCSSMIW